MRSTEKQTVFQALVDIASDSSFHQIEMLHLSSHVVSSLQLNPMSNAHELSTEVSKCKKNDRVTFTKYSGKSPVWRYFELVQCISAVGEMHAVYLRAEVEIKRWYKWP